MKQEWTAVWMIVHSGELRKSESRDFRDEDLTQPKKVLGDTVSGNPYAVFFAWLPAEFDHALLQIDYLRDCPLHEQRPEHKRKRPST